MLTSKEDAKVNISVLLEKMYYVPLNQDQMIINIYIYIFC